MILQSHLVLVRLYNTISPECDTSHTYQLQRTVLKVRENLYRTMMADNFYVQVYQCIADENKDGIPGIKSSSY